MRVFIITFGSRGDVQPYIALGSGLRAAGHHVTIGGHPRFATFIESYGFEFADLGGDPQASLASIDGKEWMESGQNPLKFVQGFRKLIALDLHQLTERAWKAAQNSEVIIGSGTSLYSAAAVSEALSVPFIQAYLQPIHPTWEFPSAVLPLSIKGGGIINFLTHIIGGQMFWQTLHPLVNQMRRELFDLPPISPLLGPLPGMHRKKMLVLYGYSPSVLPRPKNWEEWIKVTGYWFLDEPNWTPPPELIAFLDAGPPPVCIGFGSISDNAPERMTESVLSALRKTGQRGILLSGWGGLVQSDLPDEVFLLNEAPHSWLYNRSSAVVHHGGAGTTSAAFRSGVPSVIVPFFGDQLFWADRAYHLGVATKPVPRQFVSASTLADAIKIAVADSTIRERAKELGKAVSAERGTEVATDLLDQYLGVGGIYSLQKS